MHMYTYQYKYSLDAKGHHILPLITVKIHYNSYVDNTTLHIDGHESKPAISILAIVEKSQQTSNFRYFATYSFHVLT